MRSELEPQGTIVIRRSRIADYITLSKPELTFLSVVTALAGVFLASSGPIPMVVLLHVFIGTVLVGGGAGALNQLMEREYDGMMRRTEHRPLPSGRLLPIEVLVFGTAISLIGVLDLAVFTNVLAAFLAVVTLVTYLFLYTPLKRITPWSTVVGGIPGALPPVIGWAAVRNEITYEAWVLFAILFFWQMPHFFSLAWMYRKDYARASYKMLTVLDPSGSTTSTHIITYSIFLLIASLLPSVLGHSGTLYVSVAIILSIGFIGTGIQLRITRSNEAARRVFFASLIYLPLLLLFMVMDKL
jgi:protoheme IX farnesyltransferase